MLQEQNYETDPVRRNTREEHQRRIDERTLRNICAYATQSPEVVDARIAELRTEWTVDRFMQLKAATAGLITVFLALTQNRVWGLLTAFAAGCLLVYVLRGTAPPVPLLRALGIRTRCEIDREIFALKVIRGDFSGIEVPADSNQLPQIVAVLRAVGVNS